MKLMRLAFREPDMSEVRLVMFDFDGVFADNTVQVNQDGIESVSCWRSDGLGISRLVSVGVSVWVLSTESNPVVSRRAQKLGIPCLQGISDKAEALRKLCAELEVSLVEIVYVGNDINDIPALEVAGIAIAVADSYPEVHAHVHAPTTASGGKGAVREVCDFVFGAVSARKSVRS